MWSIGGVCIIALVIALLVKYRHKLRSRRPRVKSRPNPVAPMAYTPEPQPATVTAVEPETPVYVEPAAHTVGEQSVAGSVPVPVV